MYNLVNILEAEHEAADAWRLLEEFETMNNCATGSLDPVVVRL